jgi:hypothetical protein
MMDFLNTETGFVVCFMGGAFLIILIGTIGYWVSEHMYEKRCAEQKRIREENEKKELRARNRRIKAGKSKLVKKKVAKPCIIEHMWFTAPAHMHYIDPLDYCEHADHFYMTIRKPDGTTETKSISESEYHNWKEGNTYGSMEVIEEVEVPIKKPKNNK